MISVLDAILLTYILMSLLGVMIGPRYILAGVRSFVSDGMSSRVLLSLGIGLTWLLHAPYFVWWLVWRYLLDHGVNANWMTASWWLVAFVSLWTVGGYLHLHVAMGRPILAVLALIAAILATFALWAGMEWTVCAYGLPGRCSF